MWLQWSGDRIHKRPYIHIARALEVNAAPQIGIKVYQVLLKRYLFLVYKTNIKRHLHIMEMNAECIFGLY